MPKRLIALTLSFVSAKRVELVLTLVFMSNMLLLAFVGHATVLRIYELGGLLLVCGLVSCMLFWKFLARYEPKTRVLFSFFIPGFLMFNALLWLNYLTARTHTETYGVSSYFKESEKEGNHSTGVYIIKLENEQFENFKEFRMFEYYKYKPETKSISYNLGTGCLGIMVVKAYNFNN